MFYRGGRAGHAPEGSGAPVGTSYGWYILAHQIVTKLDANTYSTEMVGMKHKLAHRRADEDTWSASDRAQRRQDDLAQDHRLAGAVDARGLDHLGRDRQAELADEEDAEDSGEPRHQRAGIAVDQPHRL